MNKKRRQVALGLTPPYVASFAETRCAVGGLEKEGGRQSTQGGWTGMTD
jgi:hypothetical protein